MTYLKLIILSSVISVFFGAILLARPSELYFQHQNLLWTFTLFIPLSSSTYLLSSTYFAPSECSFLLKSCLFFFLNLSLVNLLSYLFHHLVILPIRFLTKSTTMSIKIPPQFPIIMYMYVLDMVSFQSFSVL